MDPESNRQQVLERTSITHVIAALAISGLSVLLAAWMLWPRSLFEAPTGRTVHASSSARVALRGETVDAELPLAEAPRAVDRRAAAPAGLPEQEPTSATLGGAVVDEFWHPVPFAEVWIQDNEWRLLTLANAQGSFAVEIEDERWNQQLTETGHVRLGARHKKHGPSEIYSLCTLPLGPVRLVLSGTGVVLGLEVLDESEAPLEGVQISIAWAEPQPEQDSTIERVPAPSSVTDRWGQVRLEGLAAGERQITLQKAGYSLRTCQIFLIDDDTMHRTIRMSANAALEGLVDRRDAGSLAEIQITAISVETLQEFTTTTNSAGAFLLEGLPTGAVHLLASTTTAAGLRLEATAERVLRASFTDLWTPLLLPVQPIGGRLLAFGGTPLSGWRVELRAGPSDPASETWVETDADGRYELPAPPAAADARIFFFHPFSANLVPTRVIPLVDRNTLVEPVELAQNEQLVSRLMGRVVHSDGTSAAGEHMLLRRLHDLVTLDVEVDAGGNFLTSPIPPGDYISIFPDHGRNWTPNQLWHLNGFEDTDTGTIQLPVPGQLSLFTSSQGRHSEIVDVAFKLSRPGVGSGFYLYVFQGTIEAPRDFTFAPGDYLLELPAHPTQPPLPFRIESGQTESLVLPPTE